ncbi:MAG: T9SS C-terminal target domain-containing protein [Cytophagales bacterium]|nr:MAG: T9SS C-terminal target domain-containing protein [Cytophagales bacterium]
MKLKKTILLLILLQLNIVNLFSQEKKNNPTTVPNVLLVKFKSKIEASNFRAQNNQNPIEKIFQEAGIIETKQLFPKATAQNCLKKNLGNPQNIDLSSIYEVKLDGKLPLNEVMRLLKKSNLIHYAEPQYIDYLQLLPNDPEVQLNSGKQYHHKIIKTFEAWDIEKGDTNTVIAIVDTDQNIDHPDLLGQSKINTLDPINGKDDDNDGYIDNYRGWDIAENDNDVKSKQALIPNENDATKFDTLNGNSHGTLVFGFAGAKANNNLGGTGTGFNCKILPIKAMFDKDAKTGGIARGYQGIIFAAEQGAKVINCSWGSFNSYSRIAQDAINFATFNFDALVVAAAGNENAEKLLYPCSYDNVLCVAASYINDKGEDIKANFATYSHYVDICSPGTAMFSPYKDSYTTDDGSSYSSPSVAGAAALVRSKFPNLTALQTLEQLRTTADNIDNIPDNSNYKEKLGKGRLNILRALTEQNSPAVRVVQNNLPNVENNVIYPNTKVNWYGVFKNFLKPTQNLKISVRALSPFIEMIDSIAIFNVINTLDSIDNQNKPFSFFVKSNIPYNEKVEFRVNFEDGNYKDYQYLTAIFNPDFVTLDTNKIKFTIPSNARLGFRDDNSSEGLGLIYKSRSLLFESGLIITTNKNKMSDVVRGFPKGNSDMSFETLVNSYFVKNNFPGQEAYTEYKDTNSAKVGVQIVQNSFASPDVPNDKFAIIRYLITNKTSETIDSLRVGIYTDWDIMDSDRNRANFDIATNLAFSFSSAINGIYAGVALLSGEPVSVHSHDHNIASTGNINPNDGFTLEEKNRILAGGISKARAGVGGFGDDVSQTIGGVLLQVKPNETRQIAFAFIAGDNRNDVIASATAAKNLFNTTIKPTSIENSVEKETINLFPNPSNELINLTLSNLKTDAPIPIKIENSIGQIQLESTVLPGQNTININNLAKGVYFIKLQLGDKMVLEKFLKY